MSAFELISFTNPDELAQAAARAWIDQVTACVEAGRELSVALSGGRITQKLFCAVVALAQKREMSLSNVHFFWADERCVRPDDPESNFRMARELLFDPLKISDRQIHRIRGEENPGVAAKLAEEELCRIVSSRVSGQPSLDLIFLGLGEDGHVASLFPGESEEISNSSEVYRPIANSPKPPPTRVTLGYPAIAAARQVWMLASGSGKKAALERSISPDGDTPFARVVKARREMQIFSDVF